MGHYSIRIGRTDRYSYIGVKPPLDEDQKRQVFDELGEGIEDDAVGNGKALHTVIGRSDLRYSELEFTNMTLEAHQTSTIKLARKIADVIRSGDHIVVINSELRPFHDAHNLFESRL